MKLLDKILGPMQDARSTLEKQRHQITEKRAKLAALQRLPCSPAEAIAKAHSEIDDYAQKYRDGLRLTADPQGFELFSSWLLDRNTPPSDLIPHICFLLNPQMKANAEREITAAWPKQFIDADEREKQIATLRREIEQAETLEEQMTVEFEAIGAKIDRRGDLSPQVFLEFHNARDWNRAKLDSLRASVRADRRQMTDLSDEYRELSDRERDQRQLLEKHRNNPPLEAKLTELKAKMAANRQKVAAITNELTPRSRLYNACLSFLKQNGVDLEGSSTVSVRRAS